jgi:hypothetical protein
LLPEEWLTGDGTPAIYVSPDGSKIAIYRVITSETLIYATATGTQTGRVPSFKVAGWSRSGEHLIGGVTGVNGLQEIHVYEESSIGIGTKAAPLMTRSAPSGGSYDEVTISSDNDHLAILWNPGYSGADGVLEVFSSAGFSLLGTAAFAGKRAVSVSVGSGNVAVDIFDGDPVCKVFSISSGGLHETASGVIESGLAGVASYLWGVQALRINGDSVEFLMRASPSFHRYSRGLSSTPPEEGVAEVVGLENATWLDLGAVDRFKPFDGVGMTVTVGAYSYTGSTYNPTGQSSLGRGLAWSIAASEDANTLFVTGVKGDYLDVRCMSAAMAEVFGRRIATEGRSRFVVRDLNLPAGGELRVSVAAASGDASVGGILYGNALLLGELSIDGLDVSGVDYSIVTETDWGITDLKAGAKSRKAAWVAKVDLDDADRVFEIVSQLGGKRAVFVADWTLACLFGVRERWSLTPIEDGSMLLKVSAKGLV